MMRQIAIYAGTIALLLATSSPGFTQGSREGGASDSTMGKGAGTSTPTGTLQPDKKTDLTGGKQGIPEEYADTPVRQGKLEHERGHQGGGVPHRLELIQRAGQIPLCHVGPHDPEVGIPERGIQFVDPAMDLGFSLTRLVAVSGMGLLFEARDAKTGVKVAFKILRPDRATEANVARAVEEAKSLSQIHHDHIVRILSTGRMKNGESFLVMDYVDGLTATQLGKAGRLWVPEALQVGAEMCAALDAVHSMETGAGTQVGAGTSPLYDHRGAFLGHIDPLTRYHPLGLSAPRGSGHGPG